MTGELVSINISLGGVPKLPVGEGLITPEGVLGDYQADRKYHGGPDRAISLYSLELIEALQREGHPITIGSIGENFTIKGIPWAVVGPGVFLAVGEVKLVVTSFTTPCRTIRNSFLGSHISRVGQRPNPGWSRVYAKVLQGGKVAIGDRVAVG
jgi:MOSC domain-containing protein YiiM